MKSKIQKFMLYIVLCMLPVIAHATGEQQDQALVTVSDPYLIKNINLLHKMGYLPFRAHIMDATGEDYLVEYKWDSSDVPSKLANLVIRSPKSILYRSAVLHFAREYGTQIHVNDTASTYIALEIAYDSGFSAKKPFVWVYVDQKDRPQMLYVWQNGNYIFKSKVNTGVLHTTVSGNFMIYARYRQVEMSGYFPTTGEYYDDPDVPWVNFFYKGEAIHGFPRRHYGYPQSAGCIELPVHKAKQLYPILYRYAVVTVSRY